MENMMHIDVEKFSKACSCGKPHEIFVKDMVVEAGALDKFPDYLAKVYDGNKEDIVLICDNNTYEAAGKKLYEILDGCRLIKLSPKELHADNHGVAQIEEILEDTNDFKLIIAVGSGTIHDLSRFIAHKTGVPFVSVPTAASVDGFVSTVAAMTWNGLKKTFPGVSPILVVADTLVFSKAPYRLTASGISDLLGKYTALIDWEISHMVTGEYICTRVCELEFSALKEVCDNISLLQGKLSDPNTLKAYERLMYALLLSGIAMQMIGNSRPASGAEHHISHLWEMEVINGQLDAYHGEKVSIGLMIVTSTYHKIKNAIKKGLCLVKSYEGLELDTLREVFGPKGLYEGIIEENTPDPLETVDTTCFSKLLPEIAEVIDKLPSEEELNNILTKAGCLKDIEDIKMEKSLIPKTILLSPYVRNRLTFMRLSKLLKL
jgi:glycerol-1-phosphate dehydrogenase [NAD(P)+]